MTDVDAKGDEVSLFLAELNEYSFQQTSAILV